MRRDLALALVVLAWAGCRRAEPESPAVKRSVLCAPAAARTVTDAVELRGTIAPLPNQDAQIAPQIAGRILRIAVREGDAVTAGQEVARIDAAPLADDAEQADAARAKLVAERKNAEATKARTEQVFAHGIAARQELDDAAARAEAARAAEREASAAVQRARRIVGRAIVRSPLTGVVVRVIRRPGELVDGTPATPVLEVADPRRLELVADAPAADLVRIQKGQPAAVTVPVLPGVKWAGVVSVVSPAVDPATGLGVARIALNLEAALHPPIGVLGAASVAVGAARSAVLVPRAALRIGPTGGAEVVICGADGVAHVRAVTRGTRHDDQEEAGGVAPGDLVAVDPVIGIADGDPLEIRR